MSDLYQDLVDRKEVSFGVYHAQLEKLDSVVKTVHAPYYGHVRYPTAKDKAAAYFVFLIKDHPFTDGNKRMAVLFLEVFCIAMKLDLSLPADLTLDQLALSVEQGGEAHLMVEGVKQVLFGLE